MDQKIYDECFNSGIDDFDAGVSIDKQKYLDTQKQEAYEKGYNEARENELFDYDLEDDDEDSEDFDEDDEDDFDDEDYDDLDDMDEDSDSDSEDDEVE